MQDRNVHEMTRTNTATLTEIRQLLEQEKQGRLRELCESLHPASLADYLNRLDAPELYALFEILSTNAQAETLMLIEEERRGELVRRLPVRALARIVTRMHHDDRVDLLQELSEETASQVLQAIASSERKDMMRLGKYEEGTVGAITTTEYVRLTPEMDTDQAIDQMRRQALDMETIYYGYVIDEWGRLLGTVSLKDLIMSRPEARVEDVMHTDVVYADAEDDEMIAARKLSRYDLMALPVLNGGGQMLGIATFDDLIDVMEEEASETMYRKAGIGGADETDVIFSEKLTKGSIWYSVRVRVAFLLVTLVGGLLVGGVIDQFEQTLEAIIAAAVFIPLIMDMGGNIATQSTTIFARGLALGHIRLEQIRFHILREMTIGLVIGVGLGLIAGFVAYYWQGLPNGLPELGLAVGLSLAVLMPLATLLGFFLPWLLLKLGFDHAPGADPFITTIKDFTGLALYFALVTYLVG